LISIKASLFRLDASPTIKTRSPESPNRVFVGVSGGSESPETVFVGSLGGSGSPKTVFVGSLEVAGSPEAVFVGSLEVAGSPEAMFVASLGVAGSPETVFVASLGVSGSPETVFVASLGVAGSPETVFVASLGVAGSHEAVFGGSLGGSGSPETVFGGSLVVAGSPETVFVGSLGVSVITSNTKNFTIILSHERQVCNMSIKRLSIVTSLLLLAFSATTIAQSSIIHAIVYGDGQGRPDSLLIRYADGGPALSAGAMPNKVVLAWPVVGGTQLTATGSALVARGDYDLHVNFTGVANRPRGYTSVSRGIVTVTGGIDGPDMVIEGFDVIDAIGPLIATDNDDARGGNPILKENVNAGTSPDEILIRVSEQLRDSKSLLGKSLYYKRGPNAPTNDPATGSGDGELTVTDAYIDGTNAYRITVSPIAGGLQPGDWIRFNPKGGVVDRAKVDGVIDDNPPHSGNRWVQLKVQEVAPSVRSAWYTSNPATGQVDYAYVKFDKTIYLASWFSDGSVNFGTKASDAILVATAGLDKLFSASKDTLKIDLSMAYNSGRVDSKGKAIIRTSGDIPFSLNYASSQKLMWEGVAGANVVAWDRAKPVLADTVFLNGGKRMADGSTVDTLKVTYSERPGESALKINKPLSIIYGNGGRCEPAVRYVSVAAVGASSSFYKVTYLIDGNLSAQCDPYPKTGDNVRIDAAAGFEDGMSPPNVQDVPDNLKQPLKMNNSGIAVSESSRELPNASGEEAVVAVAPAAALTAEFSVGPNPADRSSGEVRFFRNGSRIKSAALYVYDATGSAIGKLSIRDNAAAGSNGVRRYIGSWDLRDASGKTVSAGTYLVKGTIKTTDGKKENVSVVVGVR